MAPLVLAFPALATGQPDPIVWTAPMAIPGGPALSGGFDAMIDASGVSHFVYTAITEVSEDECGPTELQTSIEYFNDAGGAATLDVAVVNVVYDPFTFCLPESITGNTLAEPIIRIAPGGELHVFYSLHDASTTVGTLMRVGNDRLGWTAPALVAGAPGLSGGFDVLIDGADVSHFVYTAITELSADDCGPTELRTSLEYFNESGGAATLDFADVSTVYDPFTFCLPESITGNTLSMPIIRSGPGGELLVYYSFHDASVTAGTMMQVSNTGAGWSVAAPVAGAPELSGGFDVVANGAGESHFVTTAIAEITQDDCGPTELRTSIEYFNESGDSATLAFADVNTVYDPFTFCLPESITGATVSEPMIVIGPGGTFSVFYSTHDATTGLGAMTRVDEETAGLSLTVAGPGSVRLVQLGQSSPPFSHQEFPLSAGAEVELWAQVGEGVQFDGWEGDCDLEAGFLCVVNVDAHKNVTANFSIEDDGAPDSGVELPQGTAITGDWEPITWPPIENPPGAPIPNVQIQILRDGGSMAGVSGPAGLAPPPEILFESTPNDGVEGWLVTGPSTSGAMIRIVDPSDPTVFIESPAPFAICVDSDGDDVCDEDEAGGPGAGDGNGDGIADAQQSNVASFSSAVGNEYLTLAAPEGTAITLAQVLENPFSQSLPEGFAMPLGYSEFVVAQGAPGDPLVVTLTLPPTITPHAYYKFGPTPGNLAAHWYKFSFDGVTGAEIEGNIVTLHFVDGMRGDNDLLENGLIFGGGAPVLLTTAAAGWHLYR